jgi:hypothetical protein
VHRLAITIAGLAVHLFVSCDVIDVLAPRLGHSAGAIDLWHDRLQLYAQALIAAERRRRKRAAATAPAAARRKGAKP